MDATVTDFSTRGREILDFASTADREAWKTQWVRPTFALGEPEDCWTQFTLTSVSDFEAELGFFVDGLGLDVFMIQQPTDEQPDTTRMAMLSPRIETEGGAPAFCIGIRSADADAPAAAPGTISHEFMTRDLPAAWQRLMSAGVEVVREPWDEEWIDRATVRTPSGHEVRLWSLGERR